LTEFFRGFPQFFQANSGLVHFIRPRQLPCASFPIHNSHCHTLIRFYIVRVTEKASLNKLQKMLVALLVDDDKGFLSLRNNIYHFLCCYNRCRGKDNAVTGFWVYGIIFMTT
jgi:hypothetical protein